MAKIDKRASGRRWLGQRLLENRDVERMDWAEKRRYLQRRLSEIDYLIEYMVYEHLDDPDHFSVWEVTSPTSELWEDVMDLHYLEASRQAILEILANLNRPS